MLALLGEDVRPWASPKICSRSEVWVCSRRTTRVSEGREVSVCIRLPRSPSQASEARPAGCPRAEQAAGCSASERDGERNPRSSHRTDRSPRALLETLCFQGQPPVLRFWCFVFLFSLALPGLLCPPSVWLKAKSSGTGSLLYPPPPCSVPLLWAAGALCDCT